MADTVLKRARWLRPVVVALGLAGLFVPALPLFGEQEGHSCVCPMDSDGHCECIACNVLEIHGPRRDLERPLGPTLSGCTPDEQGAPPLASFEPALATASPPLLDDPRRLGVAPSQNERPGPAPDSPRLERPPRFG